MTYFRIWCTFTAMRLINGLYLFIYLFFCLFIYLFSEVRPLWNWSTLGKCLSVVQVPMRQWITLPNSLGCCFFLGDWPQNKIYMV